MLKKPKVSIFENAWNLPQGNAILGIVEVIDGSEEMREGMLAIAADKGYQHPRSEQRGLGAPTLLREIPMGWSGQNER